MGPFYEAVSSCMCGPKALTTASYALVAFVHFLALWTHHVFIWNSRFNCTGSGCPDKLKYEITIECAMFYILLALLLTSYWRCILTPAGSPSPSLNAQLQDLSSLSSHTAVDLQFSNVDDAAASTVQAPRR